jgi:hypothetical protein
MVYPTIENEKARALTLARISDCRRCQWHIIAIMETPITNAVIDAMAASSLVVRMTARVYLSGSMVMGLTWMTRVGAGIDV